MNTIDQLDVAANWPAELTNRLYIDESAVSEHSFFPFQDQVQPEIVHAEYPSWLTPSEGSFEQYFPMNHAQEHLSGYTTVAPQTAGFVGSVPIVPSSQTGSYQAIGCSLGTFEQATASQYKMERPSPLGPNAMPAIGQNGSYGPSSHSPELSQGRAPRRLSVAVHPAPNGWNLQGLDRKPSRVAASPDHGHSISRYSHGLRSLHMPRAHRSSNASMVGSTCSGASSGASSVAPIKVERSYSVQSPASSRAQSEDDEGKPRSHRYYTTARPHQDGNYHCPYVNQGNCTHKPTKLKCNYEYVDRGCKTEEARLIVPQQIHRLASASIHLQTRGVQGSGKREPIFIHRLPAPTRERSTWSAWAWQQTLRLPLRRMRACPAWKRLPTQLQSHGPHEASAPLPTRRQGSEPSRI